MSPVSSQAVKTPRDHSLSAPPTSEMIPDTAHLRQMAQQKTDTCFPRNVITVDDAPPLIHPSLDLSHFVGTATAARSAGDLVVKEFANVTAEMQRHAARFLSDIEGLIRVHRSGAEMLQCLMEMDGERNFSASSDNEAETGRPAAGSLHSSDSYSKRLAEFDSKVKNFADAIESTHREELCEVISVGSPSRNRSLSSMTPDPAEGLVVNIVRSDGVARQPVSCLLAQSTEPVAKLSTPSLSHTPLRSILDRTLRAMDESPPLTCVVAGRGRQTYRRDFLMRFADTCTRLLKPTALPLRMMGIDKRFASGGHRSNWTRGGVLERTTSMNKIPKRSSLAHQGLKSSSHRINAEDTVPPGGKSPVKTARANATLRASSDVKESDLRFASNSAKGCSSDARNPKEPDNMPQRKAEVCQKSMPVVPPSLPAKPKDNASTVLQQRIKRILNSLTNENIESSANRILKCVHEFPSETSTRKAAILCQLTFERAKREVFSSDIYARLYDELCNVASQQPPADTDETDLAAMLRMRLLAQCRRELEQAETQQMAALAASRSRVIEATKTAGGDVEPKTDRAIRHEGYWTEQAAKRSRLVVVRFIGELSNAGIVPTAFVYASIRQLVVTVTSTDEEVDVESVEWLSQWLQIVGWKLEQDPKAAPLVGKWIEELTAFNQSKRPKSRIRFMIWDLVELRRQNWWRTPNGEDDEHTSEAAFAQADSQTQPSVAKTLSTTSPKRGKRKEKGGAGLRDRKPYARPKKETPASAS